MQMHISFICKFRQIFYNQCVIIDANSSMDVFPSLMSKRSPVCSLCARIRARILLMFSTDASPL